MAMVADLNVMFDEGPAINRAIATDARPGIDQGTMHDDGALSYAGMGADAGKRRNDRGQTSAMGFDFPVQ